MKHPGWLLMIAGAFVLLPMGWPWVMAATFWLGFVIGCFVGTRTPRPEPPVLRPAPRQMEPPPIQFVRIKFQRRSANGAISRTDDAPPQPPAILVLNQRRNPRSGEPCKADRPSHGLAASFAWQRGAVDLLQRGRAVLPRRASSLAMLASALVCGVHRFAQQGNRTRY